MSSHRNWYVMMTLVLIAGFGCVFASREQPSSGNSSTVHEAPRTAPRAGFLAPDFTLSTLDGREISLSKYRGNTAVVVNLWATWCPPCRAEIPALEHIHQKYAGRGVVVLGIDQMESTSTVRKFAQEKGMTYPVLLDIDGAVSSTYRVTGLPTTVFVRRDGTVLDVVVGGPMSESFLEGKIQKLLAQSDDSI